MATVHTLRRATPSLQRCSTNELAGLLHHAEQSAAQVAAFILQVDAELALRLTGVPPSAPSAA